MESQFSGQRLVSDSHGGRNKSRRGEQSWRSMFSFKRTTESSNNDKRNGHLASGTQQRQGNYTRLCFEITVPQELMVLAGDQLTATLGSLRL